MTDVTASYAMPFDVIAFLGYFPTLLAELLYLHQTFTDYLSYLYRNFDILICQM